MEPTRAEILDELQQIGHADEPDPAETLDELVERKRREQGIPEPRTDQCSTST